LVSSPADKRILILLIDGMNGGDSIVKSKMPLQTFPFYVLSKI
jgi:hypothetical protein